ncbi:MAG: DUF2975 domain-containing protein [Caldibacillus debilis]|jgi:hypothetical protein|uniref:DUF2975 domain-containing protein n=1 Tax=Caldibacillus debilis TaxID=301148 RepID=A0A3E0K9A1_9BACI|nr:DUF2975 domain-containing protein [Caldibacillus debilis]MBY6271775.1 DUF2975 domain-containing protein [Bacillaceae bacterium]OUM91748.1 MAG: hypothetical protein BAA03_04255 [Caldibacillus debilis]REJ14634.1 MAG: DUF2975 domain-containing protein [Caldibacillus debilis]REJ31602.1 MAG: DUF2975 domain-containing protein [Caldibacillus debilis]
MKQGSTVFLKIALIMIGTPVLALCIFGLPMLAKEAAESNSESAYVLYGFLTVMYLSAIPFFFALYQAFKLLNYIDRNEAFSELSVQALKKIKYCAIAISILYVPGLPFFYIAAELEDAPGIMLIGLGIIFASTIIAVFAALLQKLLKAAIDIKSENDLTI